MEERVTEANVLKEKGSKYFKGEKYGLALKLYTRGAELLEESQVPKDKLTDEARTARISLRLNLAIVHLKLNEHAPVIKECEQVSFLCIEV